MWDSCPHAHNMALPCQPYVVENTNTGQSGSANKHSVDYTHYSFKILHLHQASLQEWPVTFIVLSISLVLTNRSCILELVLEPATRFHSCKPTSTAQGLNSRTWTSRRWTYFSSGNMCCPSLDFIPCLWCSAGGNLRTVVHVHGIQEQPRRHGTAWDRTTSGYEPGTTIVTSFFFFLKREFSQGWRLACLRV